MLSLFRDPLDADLFVDIGTANTLVASKKDGVLVNEPSVVAYNEVSTEKKDIIAVGAKAKELVKKTPGNITQSKPLKTGVISDFKITETMLEYFLSRPELKKVANNSPNLIMSIPHGINDVEKVALIDAAKSAGAKKVNLVDEILVAALGAKIDIQQAKGSMMVDIGGGTTNIAIIALNDIVFGTTIKVGGYKMDEAIKQYLKEKKRLIVSEQAAEDIKINIGTACPKKDIRTITITGRDCDSGLPKNISVTSDEIGEAIDHCIQEIINEIHATLENTPPELVSDVIESGIVLTGGGALVRDIDFRIENDIRLPIRIAENPILTTALGGEILLNNRTLLEKLKQEI